MRSCAVAFVVVLGACSAGEGTQGPAGPEGQPGTPDPAQFVVNGTVPQVGNLNLTGSATVGSLSAPLVELGVGPGERLDATIVGALTGGGTNADAYHLHDASALTGTLSSTALPADAARLSAGKLPVEVLPAAVPLLDVNGVLPESAIPASLARIADVYSRAQVDADFLPATAAASFASTTSVDQLSSRVTTLESSTSSNSLSLSAVGVVPGQCVSLTHGWNTTAVAIGAWERRAGRTLFVPVSPFYDDGTTDAARVATVTASSGDATAALAIDGNPASQWEATASSFQWIQLDLGRSRFIGEVRIRPSRTGSPDSTNLFAIGTSDQPFNFTIRADGSCVLNSTCDQLQSFPMTVAARYLRVDFQGVSVPTLADLEVYGEYATISSSPTAVTVCNYDWILKDLSLLVTR
jgi:hypothetical protein